MADLVKHVDEQNSLIIEEISLFEKDIVTVNVIVKILKTSTSWLIVFPKTNLGYSV